MFRTIRWCKRLPGAGAQDVRNWLLWDLVNRRLQPVQRWSDASDASLSKPVQNQGSEQTRRTSLRNNCFPYSSLASWSLISQLLLGGKVGSKPGPFIFPGGVNDQPDSDSEAGVEVLDANDLEAVIEYEEKDLADLEKRRALRHVEGFTPPESVTLLQTADGSRVYVVGVAHFSEQSQQDVLQMVRAMQPDVVMVELCSGREDVMLLPEDMALKEAQSLSLSKIGRTIRRNGLGLGLVQSTIILIQAKVTKKLNMAPGGEMRVAFSAAEQVPGCRVLLGDRSIEVTLRRVLGAVDFTTLYKVVTYDSPKRQTATNISKARVEEMKKKEAVEEILAESHKQSPSLTRVLISERDQFLVHAARRAAKPIPLKDGTRFPTIVVVVVGAGHVPGMIENWDKTIDIQEITRIPPPGSALRSMQLVFNAAITILFSYIFYRVYKRVRPQGNP
uniref:TraB domain-containing protein-like protein n=1 Tax=Callorhinchus milii TaxID=7868 RepID=V9KTQ2_CALMI